MSEYNNQAVRQPNPLDLITKQRIRATAEKYKSDLLPKDIPFMDRIADGSSTSWGLRARKHSASMELLDDYYKHGKESVNRIKNNFYADARLTISHNLKYIRDNVLYRDYFNDYVGIDDRFHIFGSGSDAILAAQKLLAPNSTLSTTYENGTEVLDKSDNKISLRNENNTPIDDETLYGKWENIVNAKDPSKKERFLSFTLVSKTGRRYDELGLRVAELVSQHNIENPDDRITLVMDAVQLFGRDYNRQVFDWLSVKGVDGLVHSGSKAPGGMAHTGFLWLNNSGHKKLQENMKAMTKEQIRAISAAHDWGNHILSHTTLDSITENEVFALLRAIDNMDALADGSAYTNTKEYKNMELWVRQRYVEMFKELGLELLDGESLDRQVPSVITLKVPEHGGRPLVNDDNKDEFDTKISAAGCPMGGYLHDPDTQPILRWGLNWQVIMALSLGELTEKQFNQGLLYVKESLSPALDSLRTG